MSLWLLNHHRLATWRIGRSVFNYGGETGWLSVPRGLVVGENPGPNSDPRTPLFPSPAVSAAGRMLYYSGVTPADYLGRLERVNQCVGWWCDGEAVMRLREIVKWLLLPENTTRGFPPRVLLLGRKVQEIWGVRGEFGFERWGGLQICFAPHPSGLNRAYNDDRNKARLGRYVRWCAGLPV